MNALQVHYTSCRRGHSSSSGFQVRSCSPGLSPAELLEIARFGNYRPPNLSNKSSERGNNAYPVALRYRQLQSGRYALIHSCYSGRDYSGREGNFMAHTLVPEQGPLSVRPTNYLDWAGWKLRLAEAEDTTELPPPLPPIDLTDPVGQARNGGDFVAATPNGEAILIDLLTALVLVRATSRRIVIRDLPDHGWRWIACLLELVPLGSALDVTISTYQFDPIDAADVNATVDGSSFSFNATQRDYEFFLFEPATGLRPNFPDRDRELLADARRYADTIVRWYLHEPGHMQKFASFMEHFKPCRVDRSLVVGLMLFQQSTSREAAPGVEFRRMVDFIREYTRPDSWAQSIELLIQVLMSKPDGAQFDDIYEVVRLCFETKGASDPDAIAIQAFKGWLALLDLALEDPDKYATRVDQCWSEIAGQFDPSIGYRLLLADDQMDLLRNHYRRAEATSLALISRYLIKAIRASIREPVIEHTDVREMALAAANGLRPRPCLAAVFSALNDIRETGALLVYLDAAVDSNDQLRPVLAECLHDLTCRNIATEWALRRLLYDHGLSELLTAEFAKMIASGDKQKVYRSYLREASVRIPQYCESVQSDLTRLYWLSLDEPQRTDQAWDWLNAKSSFPLDQNVLREVAIYGNRRVSIDPRDLSQSGPARRLAEIAAAQNIELRPDRPTIRQLLGGIDSGRDSAALLFKAAPLIAELQEDDYAFAISLVLRRMLLVTKSVAEHVGLITQIYRAPFEDAFVDVYGSVIEAVFKAGKQNGGMAEIILSWVHLANFPAPMPHTAISILDGLATQLSARRESEIAVVFQTARQLIGPNKNRDTAIYLNRLARFEANVNDRQSSLANSLRNMGRKMMERANPFKGRR
jgi:hypothetical protein